MDSSYPLYWTDPHRCAADLPVIEFESSPTGMKLKVLGALFYPGGGGQRGETGRVDGKTVLSVQSSDKHQILDVEAPKGWIPGKTVRCAVDEISRWNSRQQHSGQHLLSAALALCGLNTVSVHLGKDYTGIEVDSPLVSSKVIENVLKQCDTWIQEGHSITASYSDAVTLGKEQLRRPIKTRAAKSTESNEVIRIIKIEGLDAVGCGGMHLANTLAIGPILYIGSEKIRGRTRLKWLIGGVAVDYARSAIESMRSIQNHFSVGPDEIVQKAVEMVDELKGTKKALGAAERRIGHLIIAAVEPIENSVLMHIGGGQERLKGALEGLSLKNVPQAYILGDPDSAGMTPWVLYKEDASPEFFSAFRKGILIPLGGRGGGRPPCWQGNIPDSLGKSLLMFKEWTAAGFTCDDV